jgi:hypothetical protein
MQATTRSTPAGLESAATQEHGIALLFAISQASGPIVYRMASPEEL